MKKLTVTFIVCLFLMIGLCAIFYNHEESVRQDRREMQLVGLNEVSQLYKMGDTEAAQIRESELAASIAGQDEQTEATLWIAMGCVGLFLVLIYIYSYIRIIRPFNKLSVFAAGLARGEFDKGLEYTRGDYFGDFTWAFDQMRLEIIKARKCEKEAIENNKTVIASLAHDIKTPVASLRAYAEGLEANMDTTAEKREKYLEVIMRKCDDISRLTNDMTVHSLTGLDRLMVECSRIDLCETVRNTINDIAPDDGGIRVNLPGDVVMINADEGRVSQIIENIVNNAVKYAGTDIEVTVTGVNGENGEAVLTIRDFGQGIPDEDMPFIFDKFYRGHNAGKHPGSGLGLYIVKYLVEKQEGSIFIENAHPGLQVKIRFAVK